jgi:hypothetical protein
MSGPAEPYYVDEWVTLYHGDCREVTAWLAADVLVTDPPYGRAWRQGDTRSVYGWASSRHEGIVNDRSTATRDAALTLWAGRMALVFGDLMLPPPAGTRHVLIYDKGNDAGFIGAVGGYRRNVEAIYLIGKGHGSGLGGRSGIISTAASAGGNLARTTGHPHTKPLDVMTTLLGTCPPGVVADPFAGTGATLVAAKTLGRLAIGVELEERYCEIAARRLSQDVLDFGEVSA